MPSKTRRHSALSPATLNHRIHEKLSERYRAQITTESVHTVYGSDRFFSAEDKELQCRLEILDLQWAKAVQEDTVHQDDEQARDVDKIFDVEDPSIPPRLCSICALDYKWQDNKDEEEEEKEVKETPKDHKVREENYRVNIWEYHRRRTQLLKRMQASARNRLRHSLRREVLTLLWEDHGSPEIATDKGNYYQEQKRSKIDRATLQSILLTLRRKHRHTDNGFERALYKTYGWDRRGTPWLGLQHRGKVKNLLRSAFSWHGREEMEAVYLIPRSLGGSMMGYLFGAEVVLEINTGRNGFWLPSDAARKFEQGKVIFVPAGRPKSNPGVQQWKIMLSHPADYDREHESDGRLSICSLRGVHGRKLDFPNDYRPRTAYFYFRYLLAVVQLARHYSPHAGSAESIDELWRAKWPRGQFICEEFMRALIEEYGDVIPLKVQRAMLKRRIPTMAHRDIEYGDGWSSRAADLAAAVEDMGYESDLEYQSKVHKYEADEYYCSDDEDEEVYVDPAVAYESI